jgi:integrase
VFTIIQDSGMRPDEVLRLRKKDILWDKDLIHIPRGRRSVPLGMSL